MASRRRDLGELSPRLLELSAKTNPVPPYQITDKLAIRQTRKRREDLHAAYVDIVAGQQKLQQLIQKSNDLPKPTAPGADASDEDIAAHLAEHGAWEAQIALMQQHADQLTESADKAGERYNRAFFGDAHDDIMELTADWDPELYDALKEDVTAHFQQNVTPPPDGRDEAGELVDIDEAVDAGKSQTLSTTTGTQ